MQGNEDIIIPFILLFLVLKRNFTITISPCYCKNINWFSPINLFGNFIADLNEVVCH